MSKITVETNHRTKASKNVFIYDLKNNPLLCLMVLPLVAYYAVFCYAPMYGAIIAFKNFSPGRGIWNSPWTTSHGFQHFIDFFQGPYFGRVLSNTISLSLLDIVLGFPAPIIFALLMNEIRNIGFKRCVQTITYIPHFISIMVVCGLLHTFLGRDGLITDLVVALGGERANLLANPNSFQMIFVLSGIWQSIGWGSIIYLSALTSIDPALYEAAKIDGAGRIRQTIHVTLPGIIPTIVTLFILRMGSILNVSFEKVLLLYNDLTMEKADVISTFIYRRGLVQSDYSFSTAVGLFNSVINFAVLFLTNLLSKKLTETSLW